LEEVKAKEGALALVARDNPKTKMFKGKTSEAPKSAKSARSGLFARLGQGWGSMGQGLRRMGQMGGRGKRG